MQMLQFSGLLEQQAQRLHCDAMKICGTTSTNFLNLMENFYGVDEEEEEGALEDAASFATFVKQHREEQEKEKVSMKLSVSKASVERDELGDEEEEEDIEDSASTTSSTTKRKTLKQLKIPTMDQEKYPSQCNIKRLSYSSLPLLVPYTTWEWMPNILAHERAYPGIKVYIVVCLKVVIMAHR